MMLGRRLRGSYGRFGSHYLLQKMKKNNLHVALIRKNVFDAVGVLKQIVGS